MEDDNGRAIWALGEFLSMNHLLDINFQKKAEASFKKAIPTIITLQSPRAIAFCIKGLYYYHQFKPDESILQLITQLADNLVSKYRGVSNKIGNGLKNILPTPMRYYHKLWYWQANVQKVHYSMMWLIKHSIFFLIISLIVEKLT